MNLLVNYSGVTLRQWEQTAQAACFDTNQEVKSRAQCFFYMFMQAPDLQTFIDLINNGSDTLLFVLFSCATKCTDFFGKSMQNFRYLVENILKWELNRFTFIRQGMPPLQEYVTRTIMYCLGVLLKALYKLGQSQEFLRYFLSQLPENQFKLYILRSFIEAVEVIDYEMGYMKYRSMVYHFQDNIIPFICDTLLPFFYKTEQNLQVIELSELQQRLRVTEDSFLQLQFNRKIALLPRDQEIKASYILQLLKSIIEFSYNISYTEYEHEHVAQIGLVSFPDRVLSKIISGQFIKAFFFVIEHMAALKIIDNKLDYLLMSLSCLSRIMQSRLSGLQLATKQVYILECIKGINKIITKCIDSKNRNVLETILACNSRLLSGCQLSFIKATSQKYEGNQQLYHTYMKKLIYIIIEVVKVQDITYENNLLAAALQLSNKILLNFGCRDDENIEKQGLFFIQFQRTILEQYLNKLCTPKCILSNSKLINISDNKQTLTHLFQNFKRLATYDYEYLFTKLQEKVDNFLSNMAQQLTIVANILFLLSEIIEKQFLERTPFLHKATGQDIAILARVANKCTYLMKCYIDTRRVYFKKEATYIDLASILYSESMLTQFLSNFQGISSIKIKQPIYLHIISQNGNQNGNEQMFDVNKDTKSQETILQYLKILLNFLQNCLIATKQDEIKMLYVLEAIQKVIMKFKWNCNRQIYLKSQLYTVLESFISQFFNKFNFIVSVRTRTAKILVTLNFDDALDQYKFKICKFVQIVKAQSLTCILYDLIGAFEGIESLVICRYFYKRLKRQLNLKVFFDAIFQLASREHNEVLFKDACRLIRGMVNNKGLKANSSTITYDIFSLVLPYLLWIINQIKKNLARQFDFWCDSLIEIIETMNCILNGTHINSFLMDSITQVSTNNQSQSVSSVMKQFLCGLFEVISELVPTTFRAYPNLQLLILMFYNQVNRELLTFILEDSGEKMVLQFTLFHFKLLDLIIEYMKEVLSGIKLQQDSLIRSIDAARGFYSFAKNKSIYTHRTSLLQNLQKVFFAFSNTEISESKHQVLIFYSFSFILTNYKNNFAILKPIGRILYWLSKIFRETLINSIIKLKFSQYMVGQFEDILNKPGLSEDGFVDEFRQWVRRSDQY